MKVTAWNMACARPLDTISSWPWTYSMNVVLVHWPAHWISIVECFVIYKAMAPPAQKECKLTFNASNPLSFVLMILMASFTAFTISLLHTCCQAILQLSWNAHISCHAELHPASNWLCMTWVHGLGNRDFCLSQHDVTRFGLSSHFSGCQ